MTTNIKTIADLVRNDYNGDELPYNARERESEVEDILRKWCSNDATAHRLIERIGIRDAISEYITAWDAAHRAEYGLDDEP